MSDELEIEILEVKRNTCPTIFTHTITIAGLQLKKKKKKTITESLSLRRKRRSRTKGRDFNIKNQGSAISLLYRAWNPSRDIFVYVSARDRPCICIRMYRDAEVGKPVLVSSCVASPARYTMPSRSLEKRWVD